MWMELVPVRLLSGVQLLGGTAVTLCLPQGGRGTLGLREPRVLGVLPLGPEQRECIYLNEASITPH